MPKSAVGSCQDRIGKALLFGRSYDCNTVTGDSRRPPKKEKTDNQCGCQSRNHLSQHARTAGNFGCSAAQQAVSDSLAPVPVIVVQLIRQTGGFNPHLELESLKFHIGEISPVTRAKIPSGDSGELDTKEASDRMADHFA